jgi:hypothetical protein
VRIEYMPARAKVPVYMSMPWEQPDTPPETDDLAAKKEAKKAADRARAARWRENNPGRSNAQAAKQYSAQRAYKLIMAAKSRAKKRSLPFDLFEHVDHYQQLIDAGTCQITGLPFSQEPGSPFAPSLDRIVPKDGYVRSNVRVIVFALNMGLGKWGEAPYAKIAEAYTNKFSSLESTVRALQADMLFAVNHTSVLVRSNDSALRMVFNTERGQSMPDPLKCTFRDGTTMEFQDISMPQVNVPTKTMKEIVTTALEKAFALGLKL